MAAARVLVLFAFYLSTSLPIFFCQARVVSLHFNGIISSKFSHLEGCHRGETMNGLFHVKNYLRQLGYLRDDDKDSTIDADVNGNDARDDYFDDLLESAIKTYQSYYNLNASGILDKDTIKAMGEPRCALPDVILATPSHHDHHHHNDSNFLFNASSHYAFFPNSPRWPVGKTHLTYAFVIPYKIQIDLMRSGFANAFQSWTNVSNYFTFEEIEDPNASDLKIVTGPDHAGVPFDGPNGFLAFANAPTGGCAYFDESETWTAEATPDGINLETVARHEIGHLLGLGHTNLREAIMFPTIPKGSIKQLQDDDIQGIRALYNIA